MVTTKELNFYSHIIYWNGMEVGEVQHSPENGWDTQPWKLFVGGVEVFAANTFTLCTRHVQWKMKQAQKVA